MSTVLESGFSTPLGTNLSVVLCICVWVKEPKCRFKSTIGDLEVWHFPTVLRRAICHSVELGVNGFKGTMMIAGLSKASFTMFKDRVHLPTVWVPENRSTERLASGDPAKQRLSCFRWVALEYAQRPPTCEALRE